MKLQISFDMTDLEKATSIAQQIEQYADSFEIGSLLLYKYGSKAVEQFRTVFSDKKITADSKIVDRGKQAVQILHESGADEFTVMAGTSKNVIHGVCNAAHEQNKTVMLDLLDACSLGQSALEAKSMGVDKLLFHNPYEEEDPLKFLDNWDMVKGNSDLPIFIAGKITRNSIDKIKSINPAGIVIGKSITESDDPAQEARFFYEALNG